MLAYQSLHRFINLPHRLAEFNSMPRGNSYLQVLLVVAMLTILAAVASPMYAQFQYRQRLHGTADILLSDIRLTQTKSIQSESNNQWGIHINDADKAYVIFYGTTYDPGESENYTVSYPNSISVWPNQDIVFESITGQPVSGVDTTISITSQNLNESRSIIINEEGMTETN